MNESEAEKLIERGLSAGRPRETFAAQLLADSTAALVRSTRRRARWRMAGLAAAAVLIAAVSFLCGRLLPSAPGALEPAVAGPGPGQAETVRVPAELVTWLQAARFFKQLGMQERVTLAYERAGGLLPYEAAVTSDVADRAWAAEPAGTNGRQRESQPAPLRGEAGPAVENIRRIMAQSLGG